MYIVDKLFFGFCPVRVPEGAGSGRFPARASVLGEKAGFAAGPTRRIGPKGDDCPPAGGRKNDGSAARKIVIYKFNTVLYYYLVKYRNKRIYRNGWEG